jgi:hypothetical protein
VLIENVQGFAPRCFLSIIDLSEVKNRSLRDFAGFEPSILNNTVVSMKLTVLLSDRGTQKHNGCILPKNLWQ